MGGLFWPEKNIYFSLLSSWSYLFINISIYITYPSYPYVEEPSNAVLARVRSTGGHREVPRVGVRLLQGDEEPSSA
jgi:hypothetical protein